MEHVLIIKHGALGDFVMDIGAILFIRDQHPGAHFTLMTSSPFVSLGKQLDMFDDYIIDNRKGANRGTAAAFELQRHAVEFEFAPAQQLIEIHQPFEMAQPQIPASAVAGEQLGVHHVRRRAFDAMHDRPVILQPAHDLRGNLRIPTQHLVGGEIFVMYTIIK